MWETVGWSFFSTTAKSVSPQNVSMIVSFEARRCRREAIKHKMSRARSVVQASAASGPRKLTKDFNRTKHIYREISNRLSLKPNVLRMNCYRSTTCRRQRRRDDFSNPTAIAQQPLQLQRVRRALLPGVAASTRSRNAPPNRWSFAGARASAGSFPIFK